MFEKSIVFLIPSYNDWPSIRILISKLNQELERLKQTAHILIVNDGSKQLDLNLTEDFSPYLRSIEVLHLVRNLGHQRAIAIGLAELNARQGVEALIVMDSDGEDRPEDVPKLLEAHQANPEVIVVAKRKKRREKWLFRLFYRLYRGLFWLMVGTEIDFGNFCLIPYVLLEDLIYDPNIWNHLAASLNRSHLALHKLAIDRGQRYQGQSKMNFQALLLHGLSAISVYLEVVVLRSMLVFGLISMLAFAAIIVVILILLFTDLAIPGWATTAIGVLTIIIFQMLLFSAGAIFVILNRRSHVLMIPALDTGRFIKKREIVYGNKDL
jgi:polyisoprenyl-phosphate glycosyltransferase